MVLKHRDLLLEGSPVSVVTGGAQDGEPLLLIPGGPGYGVSSMELEADLLSSHFKIVMIDPPGSGATAPPPDEFWYTPENYAEFYARVCAKLGITRFHVLGASFGGTVGLVLAAIRPRAVLDLVCVSTRVLGSELSSTPQVEQEIDRALLRHCQKAWYPEARRVFDDYTKLLLSASTPLDAQKLNDAILPLYFFDPDSPSVKRHMLNLSSEPINLQAMKAWESGIYQRIDIRSFAREVECRVLFICGEFDWMSGPISTRESAKCVANSNVEVIANSGHLPIIEQPERFQEVLGQWYAFDTKR
ncbi:alpha/beta fold hydrolase [Mycolicibacterium fortuitum]|uniref:alpha/beta fold hydrolase n=1 Tax=Mycolicibacterium fortuitum TaxID=1766 RepID=UPI003AB073C2